MVVPDCESWLLPLLHQVPTHPQVGGDKWSIPALPARRAPLAVNNTVRAIAIAAATTALHDASGKRRMHIGQIQIHSSTCTREPWWVGCFFFPSPPGLWPAALVCCKEGLKLPAIIHLFPVPTAAGSGSAMARAPLCGWRVVGVAVGFLGVWLVVFFFFFFSPVAKPRPPLATPTASCAQKSCPPPVFPTGRFMLAGLFRTHTAVLA